ncbi:MAG: PAS domain S-box protein [Negativicutes bacterium]|nr:PAS domain S-box protein [Negativicutes bacterium]
MPRKEKSQEQIISEILNYQVTVSILDHITDAVWVKDRQHRYVTVNASFGRRVGIDPDRVVGLTDYDIYPADIAVEYIENDHLVMAKGEQVVIEESEVLVNGGIRHLEIHKSPVLDSHGIIGTVGVSRDITERKQMEEKLRSSEEKFSKAFHISPDAININRLVDGVYLEVNEGFTNLTGYTRDEVLGNSFLELDLWVDPSDRENLMAGLRTHREVIDMEVDFRRKNGSIMHGLLSARLLSINGESCLLSFTRDITERKRAEEYLRHVSSHDDLTGLYNRRQFEKIARKMQEEKMTAMGLLLCDIDGLKLTNDTMGHIAGDRLIVTTADLLKRAVGEKKGVLARIGGDEFAAIVPAVTAKSMEEIQGEISRLTEERNLTHDAMPLNLSIGYAVGDVSQISFNEIFKEANNRMYKDKLLHSQSNRSTVAKTIMRMLRVRDFSTEEHAERLQELVCALARRIGVNRDKLSDLRLLAQFHDIGKIGIPDHILFKPGPLAPDEMMEMRRHSEIGFHIAQSIPEFALISDRVLKHHEWWNGTGYPLGLEGEAIPLECRILSIADAYDAMVSDRPYRKALSHYQAVTELKKFAGIQFDPRLVESFLETVGEIKTKEKCSNPAKIAKLS